MFINNYILKLTFTCSLVILLLHGCSMGTRYHLRTQLYEPLSNDCIESALISLEKYEFRKHEPISNDILLSYSFWSEDFEGWIYQEKEESDKVILEIEHSWMYAPQSQEHDRLIENNLRAVYERIKAKCIN